LEEKILSLNMNAILDYIKFASSSVKSVSSFFIKDDEMLNKIELCIVEGITNIIEHSYEFNAEKTLSIDIYYCEYYLKFNLIDSASEYSLDFNKELIYDENDINSLPEGGMGLFLIKEIMDEVYLKRINDLNVLTMIKKII